MNETAESLQRRRVRSPKAHVSARPAPVWPNGQGAPPKKLQKENVNKRSKSKDGVELMRSRSKEKLEEVTKRQATMAAESANILQELNELEVAWDWSVEKRKIADFTNAVLRSAHEEGDGTPSQKHTSDARLPSLEDDAEGAESDAESDDSDQSEESLPECLYMGEEFTWENYLHFFSPEELNMFSRWFEARKKATSCRVSFDDAVKIAVQWNTQSYSCRDCKPGEEEVEQIRAKVSNNHGNHTKLESFSFELLLRFVDLCAKQVLEDDGHAGFGNDAIMDLQNAFEQHCKGETMSESALSTRDIFEVLKFLGRDMSDIEDQQGTVAIIKEVDIDQSGDIDISEFHQLMRKLELRDAKIWRKREYDLMQKSKFSDEDIDGFQHVYNHYRDQDEGLGQRRLRELLGHWKIHFNSEQKKKQLTIFMSQVTECRPKMSAHLSQGKLSFGELLALLRLMLDQNFAQIPLVSDKIVIEDGQEVMQRLSAVEWAAKWCSLTPTVMLKRQPVSWVERLIEAKRRTGLVKEVPAYEALVAQGVAAPAMRRRTLCGMRMGTKAFGVNGLPV